MSNDRSVTKSDVEEIVAKAVTEVIQAIAPPVEKLQEDVSGLKKDVNGLKGDVEELKLTTHRIERKLDATIECVDDHTVQLKELRKQAV